MSRLLSARRGLCVCALLMFVTVPIFAQRGAFDAELEISRSESVVVLQYHREIGMIANPDPTPLLRIYGDGRYVVHYPAYMKKAGTWEGRLSAAEVDSLLRSASGGGLLEVDTRTLRQRMRATEKARFAAAKSAGEPIQLFEVSDKEGTHLTVRLDRYKPAGVLGAKAEPLTKEIVWWGLRTDVKRHPQVTELQQLAALEAQLLSLTEAPGLNKIETEEG